MIITYIQLHIQLLSQANGEKPVPESRNMGSRKMVPVVLDPVDIKIPVQRRRRMDILAKCYKILEFGYFHLITSLDFSRSVRSLPYQPAITCFQKIARSLFVYRHPTILTKSG